MVWEVVSQGKVSPFALIEFGFIAKATVFDTGALGRLFFGSTPGRLSEAANSPRSSASQNERKSANSSNGNRTTTDSLNSSF